MDLRTVDANEPDINGDVCLDPVGFAAELLERGSTAGPGSGLGLAIARGFAEANGGRVWVEPEAESTGGSTFVLELPATEKGAALSKS